MILFFSIISIINLTCHIPTVIISSQTKFARGFIEVTLSVVPPWACVVYCRPLVCLHIFLQVCTANLFNISYVIGIKLDSFGQNDLSNTELCALGHSNKSVCPYTMLKFVQPTSSAILFW